MQHHIRKEHSERLKTLAMKKCFHPHSRTKAYPCRVCYKVNSDRILKKFKKPVHRSNHVITHFNYFDIKFVQKWTDLAVEDARSIDEVLMSSDDDEIEKDHIGNQGNLQLVSICISYK